MNEHEESILPDLKAVFVTMSPNVRHDLTDVSEKFKGQLLQLIATNNNVEENIPLQERIQKACHYFSDKLEIIVIEKLKDIEIAIDNKTVRKSVNDAFGKLNEEVTVKHACVKGCEDGFNVKHYMEIRAKAAIDTADKKLNNKASTFTPDHNMKHPELYKKLRAWCNQKADDQNVDTYMILPYKVLIELISQLPASIPELKKVKGFGAKKVSQFGKEILEILLEYRIRTKMEIPVAPPYIEPEIEIKAPKGDTKLVSYELFLRGKSVDVIAKERGLAVSTIESHLSYYVGTGELGIERLVDPKKAAIISAWYLRNPTLGSGPAKAALGDNVSYSELRFVWIYLMHTKQLMA